VYGSPGGFALPRVQIFRDSESGYKSPALRGERATYGNEPVEHLSCLISAR